MIAELLAKLEQLDKPPKAKTDQQINEEFLQMLMNEYSENKSEDDILNDLELLAELKEVKELKELMVSEKDMKGGADILMENIVPVLICVGTGIGLAICYKIKLSRQNVPKTTLTKTGKVKLILNKEFDELNKKRLDLRTHILRQNANMDQWKNNIKNLKNKPEKKELMICEE